MVVNKLYVFVPSALNEAKEAEQKRKIQLDAERRALLEKLYAAENLSNG